MKPGNGQASHDSPEWIFPPHRKGTETDRPPSGTILHSREARGGPRASNGKKANPCPLPDYSGSGPYSAFPGAAGSSAR